MVNYSIFGIGNLMLYFFELKQKQIVHKILRALPRVWLVVEIVEHFILKPIRTYLTYSIFSKLVSLVTSTNVGISPQNLLTFSFSPFATLV